MDTMWSQPYGSSLSEMVWPLESYAFPVNYRMDVEKPKRVEISSMPSVNLMSGDPSSQMAFSKLRDKKSAVFPTITLTSSN